MNNIYKVIWSKAKNCYVVASEIARSHTKSASGSEKIGGDTRRKLLASLMALSLLCGGLGVAEASVHVNENTGGAYEVLTKQEVTDELNKKVSTEVADLKYAKASDVVTNTGNIATNTANINKLDTEKLDKDVANSTFATKDALNDLEAVVNNKMDESAVETALEVKADKATTLEGYGITDAYTKGDVDNKLNEKADAANVFTKDQTYTRDQVNTKLADYAKTTDVNTALAGKANVGDSYTKAEADGQITTAKNELGDKITANTTKIDANKTAIDDLKTKAATTETTLTDLSGRMVAAESDIGTLKADVSTAKSDIGTLKADMTTAKSDIGTLKADVSTAKSDINSLKMKDTELTGKIEAEIANRITSDTALDNKIDAEIANRITSDTALDNKIDAEIANRITSDTALDNKIDTEIQDRKDAIKATNDRTGGIARNLEGTQTTIEGIVKVDNQGNVKNVKNLGAETITTTGNAAIGGELGVTGATTLNGTLTAKGDATFKEKVTVEKDLTVNGKLNVGEIYLKNDKLESTGKKHDSATSITADGISNLAKVTDHGHTTESQFTHNEKGTINYAKDGDTTDWTETRSDVTANGVSNKMKDSAGNRHTYSQTATESKEQLVNGDKSKSNFEKKTAEGNTISITEKDADGNLKSSLTNTQTVNGEKTSVTNKDSSSTINQGADQIRYNVTSKDANKTSSSIEVKADGITNTSKDGTITNDAKDIVNNATGDMTNNVGGKLTTTVKELATENFNGGLDTNVTGTENHTVTGDQNIHVTKNQTNQIDGNQENTIGGNQTTTVEGKVTENYKAGQVTNVTGDQDINVSGTQTTTATDIKRNASSGMIDTIDNDYGTNTETKVAGKTTTDVSIKGTGEEGKYIRGANESRDYLIKGTLKNTETKTVEKTSTEITDGNGKTSATIQDVNNLAGSVTNGTETGVSGIHANDNSVSIDSIVTDGNKYSVINQKKGSIQSTVVDGTNSTVILQDKDNVTIASSNGTVAIGGKDIVNKAQDTITNTAGTSITNQVKDSKVTTDVDGTTFENKTAAVSDGGTTTTKINGNHINTGRVDANELGVSDMDGANTADFSVKAGEGVKASAGNGTTTGSLDVKADEVVSSVKDADGKGSTFKQRINAIMMESKDVSIKAEETLTNEAKVITNKASEVINNEAVNINNTATGIITSKASKIKNQASEIKNQADKLISNKVGENTWENMENGKITTSIKNGTKQNLIQSDAEKTEHSVVNGSNSTVNKQTSEEITDAVTNGTTTNVTQNTATSSNNTIADKNGNANTVISTVDGTSFINSDAMTPVTGASGAGTAVNTTIKGNTITTGKVTMDYADVMKDLGVRGNANITGKTTTDSLEVTSTSTLKGDVTMESNATVKNNLTVEGTTKTKTLNVTENATVGGTLDVTGKATFQNDVDITGNVKANSYKVGDKTYIDANGIHANGQKITDVADGSISEGSKDAVNGGQLYTVKNDLEGKVNKVGANAAAMANLHPMEFDPDSKWNIAAAIGNYGSETAAALGAFYRPNDDVMVNLSTAFGTGENMVGGGVSVRLGKGGNKLSREESNALKDQVNDLTARMDALLSVLNPNMSKDFPDVPENHWAYEAVSRLAGNDIVQGYPDGEFHGERTMTRYEMAEIIYNALSRGAEAEKELVEEFKPELQAMAASEKATAERAEG